uniref:COMM domain-containing protein n=1 Tax=Guillardia theta TaxID=55529 RepID=A0A7S4NNP9_GUITH|mmetsp:Transcript_26366/g.86661  ORF Transcript_26366/g.86661 Transcript_26366/m.86661 type:complete len:173 (+) Transcript_26366:225-743(+)
MIQDVLSLSDASGNHHEILMNSAIDLFCQNTSRRDEVAVNGELAAVEAYGMFVRRAMQTGNPEKEIVALLKDAGVQDSRAQAASSAFSKRLPELRKACILQSSQLSGKYLVDFDWRLNLSLESNCFSGLRIPHLQVILFLSDGAGQLEEVVMELDETEFELLLSSIGKVKPI